MNYYSFVNPNGTVSTIPTEDTPLDITARSRGDYEMVRRLVYNHFKCTGGTMPIFKNGRETRSN